MLPPFAKFPFRVPEAPVVLHIPMPSKDTQCYKSTPILVALYLDRRKEILPDIRCSFNVFSTTKGVYISEIVILVTQCALGSSTMSGTYIHLLIICLQPTF